MKLKKILGSALLALGLVVPALGTTLTGVVRDAQGNLMLVDGTLWLEISQTAMVNAGACGGPYQVAPQAPIVFTLTDGEIEAGATIVGNDCMTPANTYYKETVINDQGDIVLRRTCVLTGASFDVGLCPAPVLPGETGIPGPAGPPGPPGAGGGGHIIQEDGSDLPAQPALDFRNCAVATDDIAGNSSDVNISITPSIPCGAVASQTTTPGTQQATSNFHISGTGILGAQIQALELALRQGSVVLANGANADIDPLSTSWIRITGPTTAFSISGFTGGINGEHLYVYNATGQDMTVIDDDTSTAANRILTPINDDLTNILALHMVYSASDSRWVVLQYTYDTVGDPITGFPGAVAFYGADTFLSEDPTGFFYDNTNNSLSVSGGIDGAGVVGQSGGALGHGVQGESSSGVGVYGIGGASGTGVMGQSVSGLSGLFRSNTAGNTSATLVVAEHASGSSANLFEVRDETNAAKFRVAPTGDLTILKGVSLVWPVANSSGCLANDGAGGLTWDADCTVGAADGYTIAQDEGSQIATDDTTLNFVGPEFQATTSGVVTTVTHTPSYGAGATFPDVQTFTVSGTWTKPPGVTVTQATCIAGGGGGGAGRSHNYANGVKGGTGGGGGSRVERVFSSNALASTVAVTVGIGGPGGLGSEGGADVNHEGTAGTAGGFSAFGTHLFAYPGGGGCGERSANDCGTGGGGGGGFVAGATGDNDTDPAGRGGGTGTVTAEVIPKTADSFWHLGGSSDVIDANNCAGRAAEYGGGAGGCHTANNPRSGGNSLYGAAGGGCGSNRDGSGNWWSAGNGGVTGLYIAVTAAGGPGAAGGTGLTGVAGANGADGNITLSGNGGGGGGAYRGTGFGNPGNGGRGGNGGIPGGGGGGGGGGQSRDVSPWDGKGGDGGTGARGECVIISW